MATLKGRRRALLVGTGRYDNANEFTELKTPVADVKGLEAVLRDPQRGKFTDVEVITDAAASRLWKSAEALFTSAGRDDFVLFYFSGHGKISQQGKLHLCATDTSSEQPMATSLPVEFLKRFIDSKTIAQVVVVLDCCFSGRASADFKGDLTSLVTNDLGGEGQGKYVMTSSAAVEVSRANPGDKYSLFTKFLIEGLETGAPDTDENGAITVEELFNYAKARTTAQEPKQNPKDFKWASGLADIIIGYSVRPKPRQSGGTVPTNPVFFNAVETLLDEKRIIPFLGAGIFGSGPLSPFRLTTAIGERAGLGGSADLATAAEYWVQLLEDREVFLHGYRAILSRQSAEVKRIAAHDLILAAKPPIVVSTTHDLILERRLEAENVPYILVTHVLRSRGGEHDGKLLVVRRGPTPSCEICPADALVLPPKGELVIYKALGSPFLDEFTNPGDDLDAVVVTESDHLTFLGRMENEKTRVPDAFSIPFQRSRLLFLGYSLDLWNYRLVLRVFGSARNRLTKSYAVRQPTSQMEELYWKRLSCDMIQADPEQVASRFAAALAPVPAGV